MIFVKDYRVHKKRALLPQTDSNSNALLIFSENSLKSRYKLFSKFTIEQVMRGCQDPKLASDFNFWVLFALKKGALD